MVNYLPAHINNVFAALSDPTRRSMIEQLSQAAMKLNQLTVDYSMSAPAISKHLRVLEKAHLIKREREGREVKVYLQKRSLKSAQEWFKYYETFWNQNFDQLEKHLKS